MMVGFRNPFSYATDRRSSLPEAPTGAGEVPYSHGQREPMAKRSARGALEAGAAEDGRCALLGACSFRFGRSASASCPPWCGIGKLFSSFSNGGRCGAAARDETGLRAVTPRPNAEHRWRLEWLFAQQR